jgi:hypothetical protein
MKTPAQSSRFVLWIDAVGGFLVCLADEVTLGQPVAGSEVDIPILGDVSRRHATIERDAEGYILRPLRTTYLDGQRVEHPRELKNAATIGLGSASGGVQVAFRRPHALSMSARLDLVSRNRFEPATDGVILMADTCILGPKPGSHVVCPGWSSEVVLFKQGRQLFCRAKGPLEVDGRKVDLASGRPAEIRRNSRLEGGDFAMSLEELA